jgi:hypothetical protein
MAETENHKAKQQQQQQQNVAWTRTVVKNKVGELKS